MSVVYDFVANNYTRRKRINVLCGSLGRAGREDYDE
jgi:hypothetical protein